MLFYLLDLNITIYIILMEVIILKKINKLSAKDQVVIELRKAIFNGQLKAGEEITQTKIADMLGVSRMPVREAIQELVNEGLININENRRINIVELTIEDISDHYEIRALLEGLAAQKASLNSDYYKLLQNKHNELKCAKKENYVTLNREFHDLIWKAADSPRLYNLIVSLRNGLYLQSPDLVKLQKEKSIKEHEMILYAIINQNKEAAFDNMKNHILRSKEDFLKNITF